MFVSVYSLGWAGVAAAGGGCDTAEDLVDVSVLAPAEPVPVPN